MIRVLTSLFLELNFLEVRERSKMERKIGIYKITNKENGNFYIGRSVNIEKRWKNHIIASQNKNDKGYDYPLYRAFRKYGVSQFDFEVIEYCDEETLNERENYWIKTLKPVYNQTEGGDFQVVSKLTLEQVNEIKQILLTDKEETITYNDIAEKYKVHRDTIRDINFGRTWFDKNLTYPIRETKFNSHKKSEDKYCIDCGKKISKKSIRCTECNHKYILDKKAKGENFSVPLDKMMVTREELKKLIRTTPFTKIGNQFGVTDNAVRKWCKKFNLPSKVKDIKAYSDEEWQNI